jgi:hypothetical protein
MGSRLLRARLRNSTKLRNGRARNTSPDALSGSTPTNSDLAYNSEFLAYAALPDRIKILARRAYKQFQQDPNHPGLEFKPVKGTKDLYSARAPSAIAPSAL